MYIYILYIIYYYIYYIKLLSTLTNPPQGPPEQTVSQVLPVLARSADSVWTPVSRLAHCLTFACAEVE